MCWSKAVTRRLSVGEKATWQSRNHWVRPPDDFFFFFPYADRSAAVRATLSEAMKIDYREFVIRKRENWSHLVFHHLLLSLYQLFGCHYRLWNQVDEVKELHEFVANHRLLLLYLENTPSEENNNVKISLIFYSMTKNSIFKKIDKKKEIIFW